MKVITLDLYLLDKAAYVKALRARASEIDIHEPSDCEIIAIEKELDFDALMRDALSVGKPEYLLDDYSEDSIFDWDCYYHM